MIVNPLNAGIKAFIIIRPNLKMIKYKNLHRYTLFRSMFRNDMNNIFIAQRLL